MQKEMMVECTSIQDLDVEFRRRQFTGRSKFLTAFDGRLTMCLFKGFMRWARVLTLHRQ